MFPLQRGVCRRLQPALHRPSLLLLQPLSRRLPFSFPLSSSHRLASSVTATMEANLKQYYLADSPPSVVRLEVKHHWDNLKDKTLRKYAHYISRFVVQP